MKKMALAVLSVSVITFGFAGSVNAAAVPTKDVIQSAQGLAVAQDACPQICGDNSREIACYCSMLVQLKKWVTAIAIDGNADRGNTWGLLRKRDSVSSVMFFIYD